MSIKFNISYTYEWELKHVLELLKPILGEGTGFKVLDGAEFSHCYIPRKGSISLEMPKNQ